MLCMQGIELVEGLSITNLENKSMYEGDVEMKSMEKLRLLHVEFCENITPLSVIVKNSPNLRWLHIHLSPKRIDSTRSTNQLIEEFFNNS